VVLADKIKHVEEHHLLELIQQVRGAMTFRGTSSPLLNQLSSCL
jgi:hypothetical protein